MPLLAQRRCGLPLIPGQARGQEYEYGRHGTRTIFIFAEPKAGTRHVLHPRRRSKEDWAKAIRDLLDEVYPEASGIDRGLDNLNTHTVNPLIEIFGKAEADHLLARRVFHPTALHAASVNIAEMELSVRTGQGLEQRIPDEWTLTLESLAWEGDRNEIHKPIAWSFDWKRAKRVFKKRQRSQTVTTQN